MKRCLNCMEEYDDSCERCPQCNYEEGAGNPRPFAFTEGSILQSRYIVGTCRTIRDCDITYIGWDALFDRKVLIQEFFPDQCAIRGEGENLTPVSGMEDFYSESLSRYIHYHRSLMRLYKEEDIISVYSCFRENQTAYAIMQYAEAMTLTQRVEQKGCLDEREALSYLYQAVRAVKKVHELGLVHGLITMDDFWVTGTGGLVLKGFAEPCHYCGSSEQKDFRNVGEWIDVYGLSMFFGEMLLGEVIVSEKEVMDVLDRGGIKLSSRTITAIKGGMGVVENHRILTLDEFCQRIFGESRTMRLADKAEERRRGKGGGSVRQNLLLGGAVAAVILVAAVFFMMGRFIL